MFKVYLTAEQWGRLSADPDVAAGLLQWQPELAATLGLVAVATPEPVTPLATEAPAAAPEATPETAEVDGDAAEGDTEIAAEPGEPMESGQ